MAPVDEEGAEDGAAHEQGGGEYGLAPVDHAAKESKRALLLCTGGRYLLRVVPRGERRSRARGIPILR